MLVLSRKNGESICIGDNVTITIVEALNNKARIGIEAPREISVDRQEVRKAKEESPRPPSDSTS